jgi:hypothetical protein
MLLRLHQKIAPEWASNLVGLFEILSFARGSYDLGVIRKGSSMPSSRLLGKVKLSQFHSKSPLWQAIAR